MKSAAQTHPLPRGPSRTALIAAAQHSTVQHTVSCRISVQTHLNCTEAPPQTHILAQTHCAATPAFSAASTAAASADEQQHVAAHRSETNLSCASCSSCTRVASMAIKRCCTTEKEGRAKGSVAQHCCISSAAGGWESVGRRHRGGCMQQKRQSSIRAQPRVGEYTTVRMTTSKLESLNLATGSMRSCTGCGMKEVPRKGQRRARIPGQRRPTLRAATSNQGDDKLFGPPP